MNLEKVLNKIVDFFNDNVWDIVRFFSIFVIGLILVKITINLIKKFLSKTHMEKISQNFIVAIIKFLVYLIFVLVLLSTIGIEVSGILTAFSAVLLAIGMALQNNIANLANGIIIVSNQMFKKGDYISVDGVEGSIEEIHFLFTTIITVDNKKVTIPNSNIVNNPVTNAGANPIRRIDFTFSVAYESDVELVKKIVKDVMISNGKVRLDKEPFCRLKVLGASSIDFFANCWVDSSDYWDVYYYVIENVYNEFKRNNISIPYNQLEIRQRVDNVTMPVIETALPERVEKIRKEEKKKFDLENASLSKIIKGNRKTKKNKNNKVD